MKKIMSHLAAAVWIFGSMYIILANHVYALNIPLSTITFPIWGTVVCFVGADLLSDHLIPYVKNLLKK
jgi:hypothetical protein